jgi:hypothetical protein
MRPHSPQTGKDALCKRCGASWANLPSIKAAALVLEEHLAVCPVSLAADQIIQGVRDGLYDDCIEALLTALHTRKRVRRGDLYAV